MRLPLVVSTTVVIDGAEFHVTFCPASCYKLVRSDCLKKNIDHTILSPTEAML